MGPPRREQRKRLRSLVGLEEHCAPGVGGGAALAAWPSHRESQTKLVEVAATPVLCQILRALCIEMQPHVIGLGPDLYVFRLYFFCF